MELLRWSTVVLRRRLQIRNFTKFHHDLCAWCPHSNIKIFMKIHCSWPILYFVYWLHKRKTHSFWPKFPSKSAFFLVFPLKMSLWKFWKKSIFVKIHEIAIFPKNRLMHRKMTPSPPKWQEGVTFWFHDNHFGMRTSGTSVWENQIFWIFRDFLIKNPHNVLFLRAARAVARAIQHFLWRI